VQCESSTDAAADQARGDAQRTSRFEIAAGKHTIVENAVAIDRRVAEDENEDGNEDENEDG
jgi:hypothetical protein